MGIGLLTLLSQAATATGSFVTGGGLATGAAQAAAAGATAPVGTSIGIGGSGIGAGLTAKGVAAEAMATGASAAAANPSKPKKLQARKKDIKTNVGEDAAPSRKKRTVASTVQGGGLKRNILG